MHRTSSYLLNPEHLVTVTLIGCGGTGSQVLTCLARLNEALIGIGHPGLHVTVYDGDIVDETNVGRQLYSPADIGQNKALISVSRINRYFGYNWTAVPEAITKGLKGNIIITCIDSAPGRVEIFEDISPYKEVKKQKNLATEYKHYYWLDFGNDLKTGQVVLGNIEESLLPPRFNTLPTLIDRFPQLKKMRAKKSEPSCSVAQALGKQDLFINSTLAQLGMNLIWKLFREGGVKYGGLYLNLDTLTVNPIAI